MKKITQAQFSENLFSALDELPDSPKELYVEGDIEKFDELKFITIVGSRTASSYAKEISKQLISKLAGYPVCIVSGLALGIDTIAHRQALDSGIPTIAFPGSGIDESVIYPASNRRLAKEILDSGGVLVSEYTRLTPAAKWTFPRRNRLMAGIADLIIIIEAKEKSGTLITARLGLDYNKTISVIPQNIDVSHAIGSNKLMRDGAFPILDYKDILHLLDIPVNEKERRGINLDGFELLLFDVLETPQSKDTLFKNSKLSYSDFIQTLSVLEIKGIVKEEYGKISRL